MRTYYTDYIQHCLRFYFRYPFPKFKNEVDKLNWKACDKAIKIFNEKEKEMLAAVYRERDTIEDNIYKVSIDFNVNQDKVWPLIIKLEQITAKRRGLL